MNKLLKTIILCMTLVVVLAVPRAAVTHARSGAGIQARPTAAPTATPLPLDGGWIYYNGDVSGTEAMFRSSPDGAVNGVVSGAPIDYRLGSPGGSSGLPVPSQLRHDASRWYLVANFDSPDLIFPGVGGGYNQQAAEIDAVREGSALGVRLTNSRSGCNYVFSVPAWAANAAGVVDTVVTWAGTQWANLDGDALGTCETLVSAGIFRADLSFDGSGAISGMSAPVLAVSLPLMAANNTPDARSFSWSPNGASVAYARGSGGLYVAAAGSPIGSHTLVASGSYSAVDWSPDQDAAVGLQTTIAFSGWSSGSGARAGVWSIQPNGSGLKLLAEAKQGKNSSQASYIHYSPFWSPAGSHLAYVELAYNGPYGLLGQRSVRRMAKDGSGNVVLFSETATLGIDSLWAWAGAD